jgi:hypothetical protein
MPINDPIAWWRLDDGSGTIAVDSSGNGYDLVLSNDPVWVEDGQIAGGLRFVSASSQKGETSAPALLDALQGSSEFTVSFWARAAAYQAFAGAFAIRDGVDANSGLLLIYPFDVEGGGNGVRVFWNNASIIDQDVGAAAVDELNFYCFLSRSATDHEMFVNNVSVGTSGTAKSLKASLSHVTIGGWNGGQFFSGDMDDVRIYNRALTNDEVAQLFAFDGTEPSAPEFVSGDVAGSGLKRRQLRQLSYWWRSYFDQWLDELESKERLLREKKRREREAKERAEQDARSLAWLAEQRERRRLEALAEAERQRKLDEMFTRQMATIQAAKDAEREQDEAKIAASLQRVRDKEAALRDREEEEETDRMRGIVRNRRNRFEKRFETAITLLRRGGWRAKVN